MLKINLLKNHFFKVMPAILLGNGLSFFSFVKYLAKMRVCVTWVREFSKKNFVL